MLIDTFARRYESVPLRDSLGDRDRRLLVQAFRILSEDMYPYYSGGKESSTGVAFWTNLHAQLSRELGLKELSPQWYSYTTKWNGQDHVNTGKYALVTVCETWMNAPPTGTGDGYVKERLSLIELGFRQRETEIATMNAEPITTRIPKPAPMLGSGSQQMRVPRNSDDWIKKWKAQQTAVFRASVEELNTRFRQAGYALHYHNGFIQASTDELIQHNVETPFWALVADPQWVNVDTDMKEALDLRDSDGRDPAFYAARAGERRQNHLRYERLDHRKGKWCVQLYRSSGSQVARPHRPVGSAEPPGFLQACEESLRPWSGQRRDAQADPTAN